LIADWIFSIGNWQSEIGNVFEVLCFGGKQKARMFRKQRIRVSLQQPTLRPPLRDF